MDRLMAEGTRPLYLMCRQGLRPLYEKFGFRVIDIDAMPPYFRRISRIIRFLSFVAHETPLVMRLE